MNRKRRPRPRTKKPKFLSLRLQFPADDTKKTDGLTEMRPRPTSSKPTAVGDDGSHQLNLFPLQPARQLEEVEEENHDHENVAYFFSNADGGATTLTGLLDPSTATVSHSSHATANNSTSSGFRPDDFSRSSGSLSSYGYREQERDSRAALVRNALKSRERDSSDEKWVCYSEVVERKVKEEEVTSSAVDLRQAADDRGGIQRLSLKLDYQEILNAWSGKGPLYIHAESSSQIVPDMNDDFHTSSNNGMGWGCNNAAAGLWTVPEIMLKKKREVEKGELIGLKEGEDHDLLMKMGQREASVLRYKEKRQNRLFSKKIRYQVRKLNAEKRPRLKGRFVKRN